MMSEYENLFIKIDGKKICKTCKNDLIFCDWCKNDLCVKEGCVSQYERFTVNFQPPWLICKHKSCQDCDNVTCCINGICGTCEKRHYYDMITEKVAVGSAMASYDPFNIIVNMNYPHNNTQKGEIKIEKTEKKHIIRCGFEDDCGGITPELLEKLLDIILTIEKEYEMTTILFHCYAGISRSSTGAIAYLSKKENISTKDIYHRSKKIRQRINPNAFFLKILDI